MRVLVESCFFYFFIKEILIFFSIISRVNVEEGMFLFVLIGFFLLVVVYVLLKNCIIVWFCSLMDSILDF